MSIDKSDLGDRMKQYEEPSTGRRAFKGQPLIVRLDGNNFHTFTKGLNRPYDEDLSNLMVVVASALIERFHCEIAYTQSDEITLVFTSEPEAKADLPFKGRLQKIETLTAAYATAVFKHWLEVYLPQKAHLMPCFDSRAYVVPNLQEAYHALLWRQQDATKNAVSMAAQALYTQKELNGKNGQELRAMMHEIGVNFDNYPYFFKRGTFVRRLLVERELTQEELNRIPEQHRPKGPVQRNETVPVDIELSKLKDPVSFLFHEKKHKEKSEKKPMKLTLAGVEVEIVYLDGLYSFLIPSYANNGESKTYVTYEEAVGAAMDLIDYVRGDFIIT